MNQIAISIPFVSGMSAGMTLDKWVYAVGANAELRTWVFINYFDPFAEEKQRHFAQYTCYEAMQLS